MIGNRWTLSTIVYQSIPLEGSNEAPLTEKQIADVCDALTGNLVPDMTVILDICVERAILRLGNGKDVMEAEGMRVMMVRRDKYLNSRLAHRYNPIWVYADIDPQEVHKHVLLWVEAKGLGR